MDESCRVVVVDDHGGARTALCEVVEATPGLDLEASLESGESALAHVSTAASPLLVVMDVRMPGIGGLEAARRIARLSTPHVVVLVSTDDEVAALVEHQRVRFVSKSRVTGRSLREAWTGRPG